MALSIKKLIDTKDYEGLKEALSNNPSLANEGIPYDDLNATTAHPLHRICDGVFTQKYSDEDAVKMARIFIEHGANINDNDLMEKHDTPLIAASSLYADDVAIFYLDNGANFNHAGCHGGTALHWAAWCGRDKVVRRLIQAGAEINKQCIDYTATPLFWAVYGLKNGDRNNIHHQVQCVKILVESGADKNILNIEGRTVFDLLSEDDLELKAILNREVQT